MNVVGHTANPIEDNTPSVAHVEDKSIEFPVIFQADGRDSVFGTDDDMI